jgi:TP901 family phage tail tape measure protein
MALADTANLIVALRLDDQFTGPLRRAQGQVSGFGRGFSQMSRGVGQVASGFDRLATRAALAAAGGLTAVVKTAIDFEDAWAGVEKTVNETDLTKVGLNFEKLQTQFRDMAREIPVAFEELAAIGEQAGALGIAAGDITGFTEVVAKLGVTTDLSSEQAATALGQLGNVLHLSGTEFNEFADALVNLGNQGASTESQIIEIAARFGAAGNQAGLSKEEILGFSSAVASMGIQVEAGGSSLSRIFNSVTTNIGTGSDKAKAFAKVLRLPFEEFKDAWDKDASGTFQDFLSQLSKLDKFEAANVLKKIGVTNTRDVNAILLMAQNTEELARQLKVAESSAGALNREAEKRFATTASAIQRFKNVARDIGFVIGKELLPVINDALSDLTNELAKPANQRAIKEFAANLAQGARDLVSAFKRGEFDTVINTLKGAAAVAKTAFDAFNALPEPIKQLALAAIIANKVSGGAVGSIAKGLGNIVGGGLKLLFERGSPANPMYVVNVGPGGAIGGIGGAAGGVRGLAANILKFVPWIAVAGVIADQLDFGPFQSEGPPKTFTPGGAFDGKPAPVRVTNPEDIRPPRSGRGDPRLQGSGVLGTTPFGQFSPTNTGGVPVKVTNPGDLKPAPGEDEAARAIRQGLAKLTLEQKLIADKSFKKQIGEAEFIRLLRRTSEFGAAGQGTSIERGPRTGRDPYGEAFLALVKRVEVLTPEVMREVGNHIVAAEQVQARLLKAGDIAGARRIQRTIDALHEISGTQDKTNAILNHLRNTTHSGLSFANRNLQEGNRKQRETAQGIREARDRIGTGFQRSNEQLGIISRKKTSFSANVTNNITAYLSSYQAIQTMTRINRIRTDFEPGDSTGGSL